MLFEKDDKKKKDKDKTKDSPDKKEKKQSRPWYDIRMDDLIAYDLFDDD